MSQLIDQSFKRNSQHTAIIQPQPNGEAVSYTFDQLAKMAGKAHGLFGHLLKADEAIGLYMQRSADHVACIVASLYTASPYTTINPLVSARQVCQIIRDSRMKVLFCDNSTLLKLRALTQTEDGKAALSAVEIKHLHHQDTLPPVYQQTITLLASYTDVCSINLDDLEAIDLPTSTTNDRNSAKLILFTSGSTGNPKGVMIGGRDLTHRIASESSSYGLAPQDILLNILPFSFDVGCNQLLSALTSGCCLVLLNSWMPKDILNAIVEFKVQGVSGVPSIWLSIVNGSLDLIPQVNKVLRYITISGGDMAENDRLKLRDLLPDVQIFKTYGQTETFRTGMLLAKDFDTKHRSVGKPVDGVNVYIIDEQNRQVPAGEAGQIVHQGTGTMLGYIGDTADTAAKLKPMPVNLGTVDQDVIFTGDSGHLDEDGFLYIHGRKDRMFKVRGNRVYPEEIEKELCTHEAVIESVCAFDKPSETITVFVRKPVETQLTKQEMIKYLSGRLPSYMMPTDCLFFEDFPRTASGKVDMPALIAKDAELLAV